MINGIYRPYKLKSAGIIFLIWRISLYLNRNVIETVSYCILETRRRRTNLAKSTSSRMELEALKQGINVIPWLEQAAGVTHSFTSTTHGPCNVYIILLRGIEPDKNEYALYVGQSARKPEERFKQHKDGCKSGAGWVRDYGICLLPTLYEHLMNISRDEAEKLEQEIAETLKSAEIKVYGGH